VETSRAADQRIDRHARLCAVVQHQHEGVEQITGGIGPAAPSLGQQPVNQGRQLELADQLADGHQAGARSQCMLLAMNAYDIIRPHIS